MLKSQKFTKDIGKKLRSSPSEFDRAMLAFIKKIAYVEPVLLITALRNKKGKYLTQEEKAFLGLRNLFEGSQFMEG